MGVLHLHHLCSTINNITLPPSQLCPPSHFQIICAITRRQLIAAAAAAAAISLSPLDGKALAGEERVHHPPIDPSDSAFVLKNHHAGFNSQPIPLSAQLPGGGMVVAKEGRDQDCSTQRQREYAGKRQDKFQVEIPRDGEWMQLVTLSAKISTHVLAASAMSMTILPLSLKVANLLKPIVKFFKPGSIG
ncbi:hypothetical protein ABFX02_12G057300 [Erythranthe guttata]